ncbi:hypothetical protein JCM19300_2598 [Algibacter lectus]|jgi:hypothetical protein|uniref:Uncharacterized protein n=1 Tax=Algibacter lectus TaxID=221126 RepID=A0A090VCP4_9FLAO|nr:hypothetical protein JCM19300_2598 [Algibacter lectus]
MNFAPNLPEQPTFKTSKFQESVQGNLQFLKGLLYLTKKIFML